jgi:hypothetical protein
MLTYFLLQVLITQMQGFQCCSIIFILQLFQNTGITAPTHEYDTNQLNVAVSPVLRFTDLRDIKLALVPFLPSPPHYYYVVAR